MSEIEAVTSIESINKTESLAKEIWQQHYLSIIGQEQIDYMLNKFQTAAVIQEQIDSGYLYFLIKNEQGYKGYLALVPDHDGQRLMISKIYVDQNARGLGMGQALFDHTLAQAKALKLNKVWLTVNIYNTDSINWYLKRGFSKVDEVKADIGNGYFMDDYILEYQL